MHKSTAELRREAVAYYDLCTRARQAGVPVSLDDAASPTTVAALEARVAQAEAARAGSRAA